MAPVDSVTAVDISMPVDPAVPVDLAMASVDRPQRARSWTGAGVRAPIGSCDASGNVTL